jgi:hypothetical protein
MNARVLAGLERVVYERLGAESLSAAKLLGTRA